MKEFILGVVVGAAAFAVGDRLMHREQPTSGVSPPTLADAGQTQQRTEPSYEASPAERSSPADDTPRRAAEAAPITSAPASSNIAVANLAGSSQADEDCPCASGWLRRKSQREKAAREAEPKDSTWAYSMEQLLKQFAATHRQGLKFEISSVDCRTTYCEIRAIGRTEDCWEAFQQVMQEAIKEPWSEFSAHAGGGMNTSDDGTFALDYIVRRR